MYNIAIIDDEQDILDVLNRFLNRNVELSVSVFSNPIAGLSTIQNGNFDLVLLDIMMPSLNGIEFLEKLHNTNPDVKIIMMTAFDTLERALESHKFGASNYITKPFLSLPNVEEKIMNELK